MTFVAVLFITAMIAMGFVIGYIVRGGRRPMQDSRDRHGEIDQAIEKRMRERALQILSDDQIEELMR